MFWLWTMWALCQSWFNYNFKANFTYNVTKVKCYPVFFVVFTFDNYFRQKKTAQEFDKDEIYSKVTFYPFLGWGVFVFFSFHVTNFYWRIKGIIRIFYFWNRNTTICSMFLIIILISIFPWKVTWKGLLDKWKGLPVET